MQYFANWLTFRWRWTYGLKLCTSRIHLQYLQLSGWGKGAASPVSANMPEVKVFPIICYYSRAESLRKPSLLVSRWSVVLEAIRSFHMEDCIGNKISLQAHLSGWMQMFCFRFCSLSSQLKQNKTMKETSLKLWGGEARGQLFLILMAPNVFFIGCLSHVHWPFGDAADDGFPGKGPYVCARSHGLQEDRQPPSQCSGMAVIIDTQMSINSKIKGFITALKTSHMNHFEWLEGDNLNIN